MLSGELRSREPSNRRLFVGTITKTVNGITAPSSSPHPRPALTPQRTRAAAAPISASVACMTAARL